jgi:hypothetical protein
MNPLPFILIIVTLPLLLGGCGGKNQTTDSTKTPEIEKEALPPIPDKVTKEFVMNLWSQPNDETDIIKEVKAHVKKSGIWILTRKKGPNKNELVNNEQAKMTLKFANQRYMVWEFTMDNATAYSAITYDFEKEKYHWWEFGEDSGRAFFAQYSGQLLDGNLIEWESVVFPAFENGKLKIRDISKTDNKIEMVSELWKGGEIIGASEDIVIWSEELPSRSGKNVNRDQLENRKGIQYLSDSDTPYTGKAFALYENGQKSFEENFNKGISNGLQIMWHENGQKSFEVIFINGEAVEGSYKYWNEDGKRVLVNP